MISRIIIISCILALGIGEMGYSAPADSEKVSLYPNPVKDGRLTVKSEIEIARIEILSIVGQTVFTEELEPSNSVRLHLELQSGLYLIKVVFTDQTNNTKRIWIN